MYPPICRDRHVPHHCVTRGGYCPLGIPAGIGATKLRTSVAPITCTRALSGAEAQTTLKPPCHEHGGDQEQTNSPDRKRNSSERNHTRREENPGNGR
jgi:hypothetical protein